MEAYSNRKYIVRGLVILVTAIFLIRLFNMQVLDSSLKAEASDVGRRTIYPVRGLIYDRNGRLIVGNKPIYDLMVVIRQLDEMDTTAFCRYLGISDSFFRARLELLSSQSWRYSKVRPELFLSMIPEERMAVFREHLHEFPGFMPRVRLVRTYPYAAAAHVLGNVGEINERELKEKESYYHSGDYIGKDGLEKYYEPELRGRKGVQYYYKDNLGRDIGPYRKGAFDTMAIPGKNITVTLDILLQQYGEKLMRNKRGSIVAIEPGTGEVLAFVSSPSFDPNRLVGRKRGKNYHQLLHDSINRPLINRPLRALYPPGSTFKPLMGLIAWQEGAIRPGMGFPCNGGYHIGGVTVGCHHHPPIHNLNEGIQRSCNSYFCESFRLLLENKKFEDEGEALNIWHDYLDEFNLGRPTGIDLYGEKSGNVPDARYYDRLYNGWHWRAATVISLAIGQGEITATPLQLANLYAILANGGRYKVPHLVKSIAGQDSINPKYETLHKVSIPRDKIEWTYEGMEAVVTDGTAGLAYIPDIAICGKTGTAQNPHGEDHSIFTAFAPRENPKIALAVVVENSGFGGTWAAPIASLMIEYYLKGEISAERKWLEEYILKADFIEEDDAIQEENSAMGQ